MTAYLDAGRTGLITTIHDHLTATPRASVIGFGAGDPEWDGDPPPAVPRDTTALVAPFAYITPFAVDYALLRDEVEDPGPEPVVVDGVEYEPVADPSPLLLVRALIPTTFASAEDRVIRECGLSLSPTFAGGVSGAATRFLPADVTDVGDMLLIRRFAPIPHDGSTSGTLAAFLLEI
jgi:hypothetical protein